MITINGFKIEPTIFPDGTSQVWKLPDKCFNRIAEIRWEFQFEAEFLHLAQLKTLLDASGSVPKTILYIDYLPYARQDKFPANDTTFALWTFTGLLNSLKFDEITILDPHSDVSTKEILHSSSVFPTKRVITLANSVDINAHIVCYPDNGAYVKYNQVYNFGDFIGEVYGEKVRNQSTGKIESFKLHTNGQNLTNKIVLIVDDICDYGNTFIMLTKILFEHNVDSVSLFVTHGLFSGGITPLHQAGISRVFTAKGEAVYVDKDTVGIKPYVTN